METVALETSALAAATDFSLWALFIRADIVVKLVMIGLILSSVWSWAIIFENVSFQTYRQVGRGFRAAVLVGRFVQNLYRKVNSGRPDPMSGVSLRPCASSRAARRAKKSEQ